MDTPKVNETDEPTPRRVQVSISARLEALIEETAKEMDASPRWTFRWLLRRLEGLVVDGRGHLIAPELAKAWAQLQDRVTTQTMLTATSEIDYSRLSRNPKLKSGYTGVYQYNSKWRVEVPDLARGSQAIKILGVYDLPEQAAWARYCYYTEHKLPYGRLEARLKYLRTKEPRVIENLTDEQVRRLAIYEAYQCGEPIENLPEEDRRWEVEDPTGFGMTDRKLED